MKILTRRVHRAVCACAVSAIDPRAVTFTAEEIRFGKRRLLLFPFLFLELFHPSVLVERYAHDSTLHFGASTEVVHKKRGTDGSRCHVVPIAGTSQLPRSRCRRWACAGPVWPCASSAFGVRA